MGQYNKHITVICLFLFLFKGLNGQTRTHLSGVVLQDSTHVKIYDAAVYNKNTGLTVHTDILGQFNIQAAKADTLEITGEGYVKQKLRLSNTDHLIVFLHPANMLSEVVIRGTSTKYTMKEVSTDFSKEKGIFYKGKPPLMLLNPFSGKPLTFFHELLGADAKRVRRLNKLSAQETTYNEIDSRFNNKVIKSLVPIKEENLEEFKSQYWPKLEELRKWSDYELYNYIKKSFDEFKKKL